MPMLNRFYAQGYLYEHDNVVDNTVTRYVFKVSHIRRINSYILTVYI